MFYFRQSDKSFEETINALEHAITNTGFNIVHTHDLGTSLRSQGIEFQQQCVIFEVCDPAAVSRLLDAEMRLNIFLPCRISVFTHDKETRIGLIRPVTLLSAISDDMSLVQAAVDIEDKTIKIIDEARQP